MKALLLLLPILLIGCANQISDEEAVSRVIFDSMCTDGKLVSSENFVTRYDPCVGTLYKVKANCSGEVRFFSLCCVNEIDCQILR